LFMPRWYISMDNLGGMISTGKTPDLFTRALRQSYQQNHLVAKQEELAKERWILLYKVSLLYSKRFFIMTQNLTWG
jgi:hypothetical protein